MSRVLVLSFLLFLFSCSSHVYVTPKACRSTAIWGKELKQKGKKDKVLGINRFELVHKVIMPFGVHRKKEVLIRHLLAKEGVSCSSLRSINITTETRFIDGLMSIVPFLSVKTIVVKGTRFGWRSDIKDETSVTKKIAFIHDE